MPVADAVAAVFCCRSEGSGPVKWVIVGRCGCCTVLVHFCAVIDA